MYRLVLLISVFLCVIMANQDVAAATTSPTQPFVSISATNMPVGRVLDQVFKEAHANYTVSSSVRSVVTVEVVLVALDEALKMISEAARPRIRVYQSGTLYVVDVDETDLGSAKPSLPDSQTAIEQARKAPVSLSVQDIPSDKALESLFEQVPFTMSSKVRSRITVAVRDQPFEEALQAICDSSKPKLRYLRNGTHYIVLPEGMTPGNIQDVTSDKSYIGDRANTPISITGQLVSAKDAILKIAKAASVKVDIADGVDAKVTLDLRDAPFEQALRSICRVCVPRLAVDKDEFGVFHITSVE